MTATYVSGSTIGNIRLYCSDTNISTPIFIDEELTAFLSLEGDTRLAAAAALERMASSQALLAKVRAVGDISLNGIDLAKQLMANAANLRNIVLTQGGSSAFDIGEVYYQDII